MKAIRKVLFAMCALVVVAGVLTGCCPACANGACHAQQTETAAS